MNIFLVAVVNHEPPRKRTWGWYEKLGEAERAVLENRTDIRDPLRRMRRNILYQRGQSQLCGRRKDAHLLP